MSSPQGEASQLKRTSAVFLATTSQRKLGAEGSVVGAPRSPVGFHEPGLLLLPRLRNAWRGSFRHNLGKRFVGIFNGCYPSSDEAVTCVSRTLTKWFFSTRLETRTKESFNMSSVWVVNLYA